MRSPTGTFSSKPSLLPSAGLEQPLLMLRSWSRHLPNAISCARLLATPILLFAVGTKNLDLFKWLLMGCLVSDILDGLFARVFQLSSRLGAFLDSTADMLVTGIAVLGLCVFQRPVIAEHWMPLALVLILYLVEVCIALWRYRRISSFHTILVRLAAYAQGIFVMSLFLWGYAPWLLYATTVLSLLAYSEELVLLFLLPEWTANVRGIYWVISRRSTPAS
jgi:phosphatidylglycerophosphate synthase